MLQCRSIKSLRARTAGKHLVQLAHGRCCMRAGVKNVQLREMLRGSATVLGDAASEIELFLTDDLLTR